MPLGEGLLSVNNAVENMDMQSRTKIKRHMNEEVVLNEQKI
jgi:hypothetical protein